MNFLEHYTAVLRHETSKKITLHLIGQAMVLMTVGVFYAQDLEQYSGLLLIGGILLMLPALSHALKTRPRKGGRKKRR